MNFMRLLGVVLLIPFFTFCHTQNPRVSILTSMYRGEKYIREFLEDITRQTIFHQCELILINANSPENEEPIIFEYCKKYPNIVYKRLDYDPGIYGCWNLGIKMSRAPYLVNANLDDRLHHKCYQIHAGYLDQHPDVDLVFSGCLITDKPNETFEKNSANGHLMWHSYHDFDKEIQLYGLGDGHTSPVPYPNNHPMWRKELHKKYGLFDERLKIAGDLEMWLRFTITGNAKFERIKGFYALYYHNPTGLSTESNERSQYEVNKFRWCYKMMYEEIFKHVEFLQDDSEERE